MVKNLLTGNARNAQADDDPNFYATPSAELTLPLFRERAA